MSALLAWERVEVRYGDLVAVDGIDLTVDRGEVVGLIGANGAGKTTTIRAGLGLLRPTAGTVTQFGETPTRATRARIGYMPQTLGLWPDLTVEENARFVAAAFATAPPAFPGDLAGHAGSLVRDLPLGLQRRIAFEVVLAHRPEALVLDEPTSGVDALARSGLWDRLRRESDRGVGVLVTTHGMDEARQCDRLVVLADGRVVAAGREQDLTRDLPVVEVVGERWDLLLDGLEASGWTVALSGARLRVVGHDAAVVRQRLDHLGATAQVRDVRATLDEAIAALGGAGVTTDRTDRRADILRAARAGFARQGYDRTTIRAVAREADVDPALVLHHFGSKAGLFAAAMDLPYDPAAVVALLLEPLDEHAGARLVRGYLALVDGEHGDRMLAMLRTAVSDEGHHALASFVERTILRAIGDRLTGPHAGLRGGLIASQIVGLAAARYLVRVEPLASAEPEVLVRAIGPTIQRYLTGEIGTEAPGRSR